MTEPDPGSSGIPSWTQRSPVVAAMLNPALLAAISAAATEEYTRLRGQAMPSGYVYLIAPLVLHRDTRDALPRSTNSHWSKWVSDHALIVAGFPARAVALKANVREGLRFALRHEALAVDMDGGLRGGLGAEARRASTQGDIRDLIAAAGRVGRWLTKLDQPATAFALLGVRP